jgi:hypothetical protein
MLAFEGATRRNRPNLNAGKTTAAPCFVFIAIQHFAAAGITMHACRVWHLCSELLRMPGQHNQPHALTVHV